MIPSLSVCYDLQQGGILKPFEEVCGLKASDTEDYTIYSGLDNVRLSSLF